MEAYNSGNEAVRKPITDNPPKFLKSKKIKIFKEPKKIFQIVIFYSSRCWIVCQIWKTITNPNKINWSHWSLLCKFENRLQSENDEMQKIILEIVKNILSRAASGHIVPEVSDFANICLSKIGGRTHGKGLRIQRTMLCHKCEWKRIWEQRYFLPSLWNS